MGQLNDLFEDSRKAEDGQVKYVVQFLWRDLTSQYDLIGPYFTFSSSVTHGKLAPVLMASFKSLHKFGFDVIVLTCDGASSNLALLNLLCGHKNKMFGESTNNSYLVDSSFTNSETTESRPVFVVICPTHQVCF